MTQKKWAIKKRKLIVNKTATVHASRIIAYKEYNLSCLAVTDFPIFEANFPFYDARLQSLNRRSLLPNRPHP